MGVTVAVGTVVVAGGMVVTETVPVVGLVTIMVVAAAALVIGDGNAGAGKKGRGTGLYIGRGGKKGSGKKTGYGG